VTDKLVWGMSNQSSKSSGQRPRESMMLSPVDCKLLPGPAIANRASPESEGDVGSDSLDSKNRKEPLSTPLVL
jgi:hypothetical protein